MHFYSHKIFLKTEIANNYLQWDKHKTFYDKYFKSGAKPPYLVRFILYFLHYND